jgi:hypothetical protein
LKLFQNFSFERATLDVTGKRAFGRFFPNAHFKINRVLKLAQLNKNNNISGFLPSFVTKMHLAWFLLYV